MTIFSPENMSDIKRKTITKLYHLSSCERREHTDILGHRGPNLNTGPLSISATKYDKWTETNLDRCGRDMAKALPADRRLLTGASCDRRRQGGCHQVPLPCLRRVSDSLAWLIRDDRDAAPNLQSAVTRGHGERRRARVTHDAVQAQTHAETHRVWHSQQRTGSVPAPGRRREQAWADRKWCGAEFNFRVASIMSVVTG